MSSVAWNKPQRITLGVNGEACRTIMDEWLYKTGTRDHDGAQGAYRRHGVHNNGRRASKGRKGCVFRSVVHQYTQRHKSRY